MAALTTVLTNERRISSQEKRIVPADCAGSLLIEALGCRHDGPMSAILLPGTSRRRQVLWVIVHVASLAVIRSSCRCSTCR